MSVTASTLASIQHAGQSLDGARQALVSAVNEQAQQVMAAVTKQPFSVDSDRLFSSWKTVARLAQEVDAMEEQFKAVYQTAVGLVESETAVLSALPRIARHATSGAHGVYADLDAGAEDAQIKPDSRKARRVRVGKAPARAPLQKARALSANDSKLLNHLKTVLQRKTWTRVTQASMAEGASMPGGSVGLALRRLLAAKCVVEGDRGHYKLA